MPLSDPNGNDRKPRWTALLVDSHYESLQVLEDALSTQGPVRIVGKTSSYSLVGALIGKHNPDYLFLCLEPGNAADLAVLEKIRQVSGPSRIIVLGGSQDPNLIVQVFRYGAAEYLHKPFRMDELLTVLERLQMQRTPQERREDQGCVIGFWGSRGGGGTTTVACSVSQILQQRHSTLLMDLNLAQGDLSVYWDITPAYTLKDLLAAMDRIDSTLVGNFTTRVNDRLSLLLLPIQGLAHGPDVEIEKIIDIVRRDYAFVALDLGRDLVPANRVFSILDKLFLVVNQNLPSLHLAAQKLRWLAEGKPDGSAIELIVSGYNRKSDITLKHIERTLGMPAVHCIRHDEASVLKAMNGGKPLCEASRRSYPAQDLRTLAESLEAAAGKAAGTAPRSALRLQPFLEKTKTALETRMAEERL